MAETKRERQEQATLGNIFSVERAGDLLGGIPYSTVRAWVASGKLDAIRVGRRWMITRQSLERLLERG
jgi:excisionase family DNA binding protein